MVNNTNISTRLQAFYFTFLIVVFSLAIVLPIVAGIMHYYGGPCGSYTGPYPATAKGGECVYQPISN